ncbi:hypothetical protein CEXT_587671 [Caerostris extrusa]|uniref:Uncharacterized protein n=1 Tax=Caerostris extrusa TaxID=172846 RepID=A0AAV4Y637_CAEEX|nr:hypothetical protein CEXT_587671 [Caerostris extrusa]
MSIQARQHNSQTALPQPWKTPWNRPGKKGGSFPFKESLLKGKINVPPYVIISGYPSSHSPNLTGMRTNSVQKKEKWKKYERSC